MVGIECAWKQFPDMWEKPRQIFVTHSGNLAAEAEKTFLKHMLSVEAASYTPEELRKLSENINKEMEYLDADDMDQRQSGLPMQFSELTDDDFPLFITYKRVCARCPTSPIHHL